MFHAATHEQSFAHGVPRAADSRDLKIVYSNWKRKMCTHELKIGEKMFEHIRNLHILSQYMYIHSAGVKCIIMRSS